MKVLVWLLLILVVTVVARPQIDTTDQQQPMPYNFVYQVNVGDTFDIKEHKETVTPSGKTEGEYRWLQPNGLFKVIRYTVEGDSGFQATVTEEAGDPSLNLDRPAISAELRDPNTPIRGQRVFGDTQTPIRQSSPPETSSRRQSFNRVENFQNRGFVSTQERRDENFEDLRTPNEVLNGARDPQTRDFNRVLSPQRQGVNPIQRNPIQRGQVFNSVQTFQNQGFNNVRNFQNQDFSLTRRTQSNDFNRIQNQNFQRIEDSQMGINRAQNSQTPQEPQVPAIVSSRVIEGDAINVGIRDRFAYNGGIVNTGEIDGGVVIGGRIIDGSLTSEVDYEGITDDGVIRPNTVISNSNAFRNRFTNSLTIRPNSFSLGSSSSSTGSNRFSSGSISSNIGSGRFSSVSRYGTEFNRFSAGSSVFSSDPSRFSSNSNRFRSGSSGSGTRSFSFSGPESFSEGSSNFSIGSVSSSSNPTRVSLG